MSAPLVELTRGAIVDDLHRGDLAVVGADGELRFSAGDPMGKVAYWRSSAKPFQAIPLIASGAAERWALTSEDVAVITASHSGEPVHVDRVASLLDRIGCTSEDLACGVHPPLDPEAARALADAGAKPTALHSNCSGKHTGMLALALQLGVPTDGYLLPGHPVQQEIRKNVARFSGVEPQEVVIGVDGCGVPCFGTSVYHVALAFARLMAPEDTIPEPYATAAGVVRGAMIAHPYLVAGNGRLDTELMQAGGGALLSKGGAGGVQCVGLGGGLGLAVKIEDGAAATAPGRPAGFAALEALRQLGALDSTGFASLERHARPRVESIAGEVVGDARAVFELSKGIV